jgi:diguanylate cyclase (GGDEF)-like protein
MPRSASTLTPLPNSQQNREAVIARQLSEFTALRASNPTAALARGYELLKSFREENAQAAIAHCLRHLGSILAETGDPHAGLKFVIESEQIFRMLNDPRGIIATLAVQGTCLAAQGLHQRALRTTLQAMRKAREAGLREDVARLSSGLGSLYRATGKYDLATQTYRAGMRLASRLKMHGVYLSTLNNLAMCALDQNDPTQALRLAQRVIRFDLTKPETAFVAAYANHTFGAALLRLKRFPEARSALLFAYELARVRALTNVERRCAFDLGKLAMATCDNGLAREYLDLAHYAAIHCNDRHEALQIAISLALLDVANPNTTRDALERVETYLKAFDQSIVAARRDALELEKELDLIRDEAERGKLKQVELAARLSATQRRAQELSITANTDALTGLRNRRALAEYVSAVLVKPEREAYSVLMFDVDRFKAINDAFGHPVGDQALSDLANAVRGVLRAGDEFFRYGGDEFLVVASGRGARSGAHLAEEIIRVARTLAPSGSDPVTISVSVGVMYVPATSNVLWSHVMQRVDAALLCAKVQGRSRVVSGRITPASLRSETE